MATALTADLRIIRLTPALGARVEGIDLRHPVDGAVAARLRAALAEHIVLNFPNQPLTQDQQLRFAEVFGKVAARSRPDSIRAEAADPYVNSAVMLVSNIRNEKGEPIGSLPDGEMWFHQDMVFVEVPNSATMLNAIEIPSTGGNTKFSNLYLAWDRTPERIRRRIDGRRALQTFNYHLVGRFDPNAPGAPQPNLRQAWQPVVLAHPATGRKALMVNRLMTVRIEGLPEDESRAILDELYDIIEDPTGIYEHVWAVDDLLIWDNLASAHARTDFPPTDRRLLRRLMIQGQKLSA
jgi:taurine dioxygenase